MPYRPTERTEARKAETRERIVAAALDLLAEGGYASAGVQAVAARAGVATGSLYRHFASKDDLFTEVFRIAAARELAAVEEVARRGRRGGGGGGGGAARRGRAGEQPDRRRGRGFRAPRPRRADPRLRAACRAGRRRRRNPAPRLPARLPRRVRSHASAGHRRRRARAPRQRDGGRRTRGRPRRGACGPALEPERRRSTDRHAGDLRDERATGP